MLGAHMDRPTFEAIRDTLGKTIPEDIRFARRQAMAPALVVDGVRIENDAGVHLVLSMTYNPRMGHKSINVHIPGIGPICRLDVDGPPHRPAGRSHKHALRTERCPDRNLPEAVIDRPDLSGRPWRVIFAAFCAMANISHTGHFYAPDEGP